jgi:hypothetical protein
LQEGGRREEREEKGEGKRGREGKRREEKGRKGEGGRQRN